MTRFSETLRNYPKKGEESAFYKSLYNFYISLVVHWNFYFLLALLSTYLSDLKKVVSGTFKLFQISVICM